MERLALTLVWIGVVQGWELRTDIPTPLLLKAYTNHRPAQGMLLGLHSLRLRQSSRVHFGGYESANRVGQVLHLDCIHADVIPGANTDVLPPSVDLY